MMLSIVQDGVHPPLDYAMSWVWYRLSTAEAWLRSLPVLWSCVAVVGVFLRAGGSRAPMRALAAASAFATFPLAVYLGQEFRPYAAGVCLAALFDAARASHEKTGRASLLVGAGFLGLLATWTLYWAGLFVAFSWAYDAVRSAMRRDRIAAFRAAVLGASTVVLFLPWLLAVSRAPRESAASSNPEATASLLLRFAGGLVADRQEDVKQPVVAILIWAMVGAGLLVGPRTERIRAFAELAVFSGGVLIALSFTGHWWALRYMAIALLPLSLAIGYFFEWASARPVHADVVPRESPVRKKQRQRCGRGANRGAICTASTVGRLTERLHPAGPLLSETLQRGL